jgi:fibronectin type 3 domain-containing protein
MKKKIKIYFLILFCTGVFGIPLGAQTGDSVKVQLLAHPAKDRILLRWAITDASAWQKSLSKGYTVERYTIRRNGNILPEQEKKILTPAPLSAAPEEEWTTLALKNRYAAILAQALFGESFEVDGLGSGSPNPISKIIQTAEAAAQRYSFALYAADMCFEAACLAGWGYEDKDVKPGEFYLYRVIPVGFDTLKYSVQYGFSYTGTDETGELPRPVDLVADFGDKSVQLYWNTSLYRTLFTAYYLEKSEDNVYFERSEMPYTPLDDKDYMMYADSLAENGKTYYYRICGLNIFGEISKPSDIVSGKGVESLHVTPVITKTHIFDTQEVEIQWAFDETEEPLVRSFDLLRSDNDRDAYQTVAPDIPANARSVRYKGLKSSNYFRIAVNGLNGEQHVSFPVLVMPVDSIPPAAPQKLTAKADTTGAVALWWQANTEPDMLGYKVYRGNAKGEELIPLNREPQPDTQYVDTVDLENLNAYVYYALIAFDTHYNQSAFSEIIEVEKPLKAKPSPPAFIEYRSENDGITLRWAPSPGKEVARHTLYRREGTGTDKKVLKIIPQTDTTTVYKDMETEGNKTYFYTITATSKWQIESNPSPEYQISSLPAEHGKALKNLKAVIDREKNQIQLTWEIITPGKVRAWKIYRAENEAALSVWKTIPAGENSIQDSLFPMTGDTYQYMIIAEMSDGGFSYPEKITVNF